MKRFVSLVLVLVLVGSMMPVVAAEENHPCSSCSGVITIPNDVKSSIVRGSIAYLKAVQVFNGRDSLMLRERKARISAALQSALISALIVGGAILMRSTMTKVV